MVTVASFKKLVLTFPDVVELLHFHKTSFRENKKIFSTLDEKEKYGNVKIIID